MSLPRPKYWSGAYDVVHLALAPLLAASAYGFAGLLSTLGIVGSGWLSDRIGHRRTALLTFIGGIAAMKENDVILSILGLIDLSFTGNLILIVIAVAAPLVLSILISAVGGFGEFTDRHELFGVTVIAPSMLATYLCGVLGILGIGGAKISTLAEFYQKMWATGDAGVKVPLDVESDHLVPFR